MAAPAGSRDPPSNYPANLPALPGRAQPSYDIPIDTELTSMSPSYQFHTQLQEAAANSTPNDMSVDVNGAAGVVIDVTGMAPPQTPAAVQGASRASISSDAGQTPQAGDKRKRSKTSRACDQCRKKKIRCDAPVDETGTPKTCGNCVKANTNCEFERKPMKRGPSKGYIKELAERVQQVEEAQKRQSIDAGMFAAAESMSPDDTNLPSALPPPSALSAGSNEPLPFSTPGFQRDLIPTSGTWDSNPSSSSAELRSRDSGSVALAPNETLPIPGQASMASAESSNTDPDGQRPAKRPRVDDPLSSARPVKMDAELLKNYYSQYHSLLPILPDVDTVVGVTERATVGNQHAFMVAVELLPNLRAGLALNGTPASASSAQELDPALSPAKRHFSSDTFQNYHQLERHICEHVFYDGKDNSEDDNVVLMWTLLLLAVTSENDVDHLDRTLFCKSKLLDCTERLIRMSPRWGPRGFFQDRAKLEQVLCEGRKCTLLLVELHRLMLGPHSNLSLINVQHRRPETADIPESSLEAHYLAHAASQITLVLSLLNRQATGDLVLELKSSALPLVEDFIRYYPSFTPETPVVKEFELLLKLAASCREADPTFALRWAVQLSSLLLDQSKTDQPRFNPVDMHGWALATIALCEIACDVAHVDTMRQATSYLMNLRSALEQISQAFHKNYGFEWFYAPAETDAANYKLTHWSDCLVAMINYVKKRGASAEFGSGNDYDFSPRYTILLQKGWLSTMTWFKGPEKDPWAGV